MLERNKEYERALKRERDREYRHGLTKAGRFWGRRLSLDAAPGGACGEDSEDDWCSVESAWASDVGRGAEAVRDCGETAAERRRLEAAAFARLRRSPALMVDRDIERVLALIIAYGPQRRESIRELAHLRGCRLATAERVYYAARSRILRAWNL